MSGRELDPDGTDSYHPQHPWEQTMHPLYLPSDQRTRSNWPPVPAQPAGPYEERVWRKLPKKPTRPAYGPKTFGPGFTYPGGSGTQ